MFFVVSSPVFAQTPDAELEIHPITPTPVPEVIYTLPYPGILPDNPLYPLKATRDRIVSLLISDPRKKAEFDLLQADKRLQAGLFLLRKDDPDVKLVITTISKGQNYMHEALSGIERAKREVEKPDGVSPTGTAPSDVGDLPDRLYKATGKHYEVLIKEKKRIPEAFASDYQLLVKRAEEYAERSRKLQ